LSGGELLFSSALGGGEAPEDGGDHLVVVLEGIVIAPRWSTASIAAVGVVVELFVLELLGETKAVFHLMFGILVEGAGAIEDLLVLLVIVALGTQLIDGSDKVVWPAVAILTRLGSFWPITTDVLMETSFVIAAVIVASFVRAVIVAVRLAICARIFVETHLSFLRVSVLVGGRDHLADAYRWLVVELGTELTVMKSSNKGGDHLSFRDVGNRIPHLRKLFDVATEELGWFLINAIQIELGAQPNTRSHVIVGEYLLQLFPRFDGI